MSGKEPEHIIQIYKIVKEQNKGHEVKGPGGNRTEYWLDRYKMPCVHI